MSPATKSADRGTLADALVNEREAHATTARHAQDWRNAADAWCDRAIKFQADAERNRKAFMRASAMAAIFFLAAVAGWLR